MSPARNRRLALRRRSNAAALRERRAARPERACSFLPPLRTPFVQVLSIQSQRSNQHAPAHDIHTQPHVSKRQLTPLVPSLLRPPMGPSRSARLRPLLLALLLATPLLAFPSPTPLSPLQLERRQFSGGIIGGILGTGSTTGTTTGTTTAATTTGVTTTAETTTEATTSEYRAVYWFLRGKRGA